VSRGRNLLESQLNSFDPGERRHALRQLARTLADPPAGDGNVNLHAHSFFSYNAYGWSPSRIAWEARQAGLYAAGLCDFDVLDGLEEFLAAGRLLRLRVCVHIETRAFVRDCSGVDISSPGEPGVTYIMGAGFGRDLPAVSPQAQALAAYRRHARERNLVLLERINVRLPEIPVDYERDVAPATPARAPTERHIVSAYVDKARSVFAGEEELAAFWSRVTGKSVEAIRALAADRPALEEVVRSKLVKRGGIGYEQPSPDTFPPVEDFIRWVLDCGAIPTVTWLDGTSGGERDAENLLQSMAAKGCAALNIIPDRNWNVADALDRAVKRRNLAAIVGAAERLALPINIGTELNKLGLPFTDELTCEALRPYREIFLRGARIMVGHSLLLRYAGLPYAGDRARAAFPDVRERNRFFEAVGARPPMAEWEAEQLDAMGEERAFARLSDAARRRD
jgi:hypothetical protein